MPRAATSRRLNPHPHTPALAGPQAILSELHAPVDHAGAGTRMLSVLGGDREGLRSMLGVYSFARKRRGGVYSLRPIRGDSKRIGPRLRETPTLPFLKPK